MLEDIETELVILDSHASRSGTEDAEADCTLVIFSVTDPGSLVTATHRLEAMSLAPSPGGRARILVGNKVDLVRTRAVDITGELEMTQDCFLRLDSEKTETHVN